jgi:hypothetical protein
MNDKITFAVLAASVLMIMGTATAQQKSDVNVTVGEDVQLDVRPSTLSYGEDSNALEPGDNETVSDEGFEQIELSNIGSQEIGNIYAEATMPSNRTFGATGLNTGERFDTGNFITVSTEEAQGSEYDLTDGAIANLNDPHFLNRVEYASQTPPSYLSTESAEEGDSVDVAGSFTIAETEVGRFRVGGAEYFWVMYLGTEDGTGGTNDWLLRIGETPHTSDSLGTVDFTNEGTDYVSIADDATDTDTTNPGESAARIDSVDLVSFDTSASGNYSGQTLLDGQSAVGSTTLNEVAGTQVRDYNLYLDFASSEDTEDYILRTSVNTHPNDPVSDLDIETAQTSGDMAPIFSSSNEDEKLQPGQSFPLDIGVQLPLGVAQDRITEGKVSVTASASS